MKTKFRVVEGQCGYCKLVEFIPKVGWVYSIKENKGDSYTIFSPEGLELETFYTFPETVEYIRDHQKQAEKAKK